MLRALIRRRWETFETSSGFSNRTPDFGVFPSGSSFAALRMFVDAFQSLALTLHSHTLALVRTQLPVVRHLLATVRDSVPLIGDAISLISDSLASRDLILAPRKNLLTLIGLSSATIEFPNMSARSSLTMTQA